MSTIRKPVVSTNIKVKASYVTADGVRFILPVVTELRWILEAGPQGLNIIVERQVVELSDLQYGGSTFVMVEITPTVKVDFSNSLNAWSTALAPAYIEAIAFDGSCIIYF